MSINLKPYFSAKEDKLQSKTVEVGILSKNKVSVPKRGVTTTFKGKKKTAIKKKGKSSLMALAVKLEKKYKVFSKALDNATKHELDTLAKAMSSGSDKEIEQAAIAIIRGGILRGSLGKNTTKTTKTKGFNWLLVDTGTFYKELKARIKGV